jgi:prolyl-tRNA editing enzyme YbaK/EbsC (Cys-tRNA(Pro) deacylase)
MEDLEHRVTALERRHFGCEDESKKKNHDAVRIVENVDESMRRARRAVEEAGLYSATWKFVPEPYYTWPLSQRAICLGAPSVRQLCKSLLLENRKAPASSKLDPTYPKYVLVVIQYAATLDAKLLVNSIRALRPVKERFDESHFDFRIASEADNDRLTGYQHNSVTPFGLLARDQLVLVLAEAVVPLKFFWMGGGHVHLKLGMSVSNFCQALQPIVAPISQPRIDMEIVEEAPPLD